MLSFTILSNRFVYSLLIGFHLLAFTNCLAQTIHYVSTTGTNTNPATATSWATSTTNLQGAINASAAGDQVWVKAGIYKPTGTPAATTADRTISFAMKNGVAIYGGFAGTETTLGQRILTNPLATTLSGEIGNPASTTDNSYHVISNPAGLTTGTPDRTAILDGFVITGGNANGDYPNSAGGGLFNDGSGSGRFCTPLLRNCSFIGNKAISGGAVYNAGFFSGNASPSFMNCLFRQNEAAGGGGAIFNDGYAGNSSPVVTNCLFQSNTASSGGVLQNDSRQSGTSSPVLTNCSFLGNSSGSGGLMYNFGSGSPGGLC